MAGWLYMSDDSYNHEEPLLSDDTDDMNDCDQHGDPDEECIESDGHESDSDKDSVDGMNDVTLQYLLNANTYQRVMKSKAPEEYGDVFLDKMKQYKREIVDTVNEIIEGKVVSTDVNEAFRSFAKAVFRTWELEAIQETNEKEREEYETKQMVKDSGPGWSFWSSERVVKRG